MPYSPPTVSDHFNDENEPQKALRDELETQLGQKTLLDAITWEPIEENPFPLSFNLEGEPVEYVSLETLNKRFRDKYQKGYAYCGDAEFITNPFTRHPLTAGDIKKQKNTMEYKDKCLAYRSFVHRMTTKSGFGWEMHECILEDGKKALNDSGIVSLKKELMKIVTKPESRLLCLSELVVRAVDNNQEDTISNLELYLLSFSELFVNERKVFWARLVNANPKLLPFVYESLMRDIKNGHYLGDSALQSWGWYKALVAQLSDSVLHQESPAFMRFAQKEHTELEILEYVEKCQFSKFVEMACSSKRMSRSRVRWLATTAAEKAHFFSEVACNQLHIMQRSIASPVMRELLKCVEQFQQPYDYWMAAVCANPAVIRLVPLNVLKHHFVMTRDSGIASKSSQGYWSIAIAAIYAKPSEIGPRVLCNIARSYFSA